MDDTLRDELIDKYLPDEGEGKTMATQAVTAMCKIVYRWYNDGDVFDNTYFIEGWVNNLSTYANWLYNKIEGTQPILEKIYTIRKNEEYSELVNELEAFILNENLLSKYNYKDLDGSIYTEQGIFRFIIPEYDDEDEEDDE